MSNQKLATILHTNLSHAPILTDGEITPKIVREFEKHCNTFFINAKGGVPDNEKVTRILGVFEHPEVSDWTDTDGDRLGKLTFPEFMKEFRRQFLLPNWEQTVQTQMLGTHLDPDKHKFETWSAQILAHNTTLRNTDSHMTDEKLHSQMAIMLDEDLRNLAIETKASEIKELKPWMNRIRELDTRRQSERQRMREFFDTSLRASKRQNTTISRTSTFNGNNRNYTRPGAPSSSETGTSNAPTGHTYPPRLTTEERQLLFDHEGCLKCRTFYAGHRANQCSTILPGKDYRTRTLQDAL